MIILLYANILKENDMIHSDPITFTVPLKASETRVIVKALRHYIANNQGQSEDTELATKLAFHMDEAYERTMGKEYDPVGWKVVK